jgi:hypothetical protein
MGAIPVIGPWNPEQLGANLAGGKMLLDEDQASRPNAVASVPMGYPYDWLKQQQDKLGLP